jgi:hypothetical protein
MALHRVAMALHRVAMALQQATIVLQPIAIERDNHQKVNPVLLRPSQHLQFSSLGCRTNACRQWVLCFWSHSNDKGCAARILQLDCH